MQSQMIWTHYVPMLVSLVLAAPVVRADETTSWNKKAAAEYLDARADHWRSKSGKRLSTVVGSEAVRIRCLSCHTTFTYAFVRPALQQARMEAEPGTLTTLYKEGADRLQSWGKPQHQEMYNGQVKVKESRGTEAVLLSLIFATKDSMGGAGKISKTTSLAFERLWEEQIKEGVNRGSWYWLDFSLEPWESKDAQYHGAALAALAVGTAPGYAASDALPKDKWKLLQGYLTRNYKNQRLFNRIWVLLASTRNKELLTAQQRSKLLKEINSKRKKKVQGEQGQGWSLLDLMPKNHAQGRTLDNATKQADGYATGLIVYTLQQCAKHDLGVRKDSPLILEGIQWLKAHQHKDGHWPTESVNQDRPVNNEDSYLRHKFMTDGATAFAVLALSEAEKTARLKGRTKSVASKEGRRQEETPARRASERSPLPDAPTRD